ncbi:MAG: hypothetical protein QM498_08700 [Desulfobacterium sp.]
MEFEQLDVRTLYRLLLKLRVDVFVVEQQCSYAELDGLDIRPGTRHLLGRESDSGELVAYLRILPPGLVFPEVGLGRFMVLVTVEKKGSRIRCWTRPSGR